MPCSTGIELTGAEAVGRDGRAAARLRHPGAAWASAGPKRGAPDGGVVTVAAAIDGVDAVDQRRHVLLVELQQGGAEVHRGASLAGRGAVETGGQRASIPQPPRRHPPLWPQGW